MLKKTSLFLSPFLRQQMKSNARIAISRQIAIALDVPNQVVVACIRWGQLDEYQGPPELENILCIGHTNAEAMHRVFLTAGRIETHLQTGLEGSISLELSFWGADKQERPPFKLQCSITRDNEIRNVACVYAGC